MSADVVKLPVRRREDERALATGAPTFAEQAEVVEQLIPVLRRASPQLLREGLTREQHDLFFSCLEHTAAVLRRLSSGGRP